jgi:acetyl-CoA carboxylase carboxyl transferase subunit alpha
VAQRRSRQGGGRGAQGGREAAITAVGDRIEAALERFSGMDGEAIRAQRREKFLAMGNGSLA